MITTVLADDHEIVRFGIKCLIEDQDDFTIVGEAADGLDAVELIARLKPAVAILDVQLPGLTGIEVTRRAAELAPDTRIIILSMFSDEAFVRTALRNGASAYVLKSSAAADLVDAVQTVVKGKRYLSPQLTERAVDAYATTTSQSEEPYDRYDALTSREREVLQLAAEGMSNAAIGTKLSISPRTVETHRTNLNRKLNLQSHHELIKFAESRKLISSDGPDTMDPEA